MMKKFYEQLLLHDWLHLHHEDFTIIIWSFHKMAPLVIIKLKMPYTLSK
jgi:hypothetical protein